MNANNVIMRGVAATTLVSILSGCQLSPSPDNITESQIPLVQKSCVYHPFDGIWMQKQFGDICVAYNDKESKLSVYEFSIEDDSGSLFTVSTDPKLNIEGHRVKRSVTGLHPRDIHYELLEEIQVDLKKEEDLIRMFYLVRLLKIDPASQGSDI